MQGQRPLWVAAALATGVLAVACAELLGLAPLEEGPDPADASSAGAEVGASGDAGSPGCSNGEKDGDETDEDCGGSCAKCAKGKACKVDADCAKSCVEGVCSGCAGVAIPDSDGEACIDSTEVRVRDYDAFLSNAAKNARPQDARCQREVGSSRPDNFADQLLKPELPVRRVDWCSAKAYCLTRGQKLCGPINANVPLTLESYKDATQDQWMAACVGQNRTEYPYDGPYSPIRCNGLDKGVGGPWNVGGEDCKTVGLAIYDLSGNLAEWEDACVGRQVEGRDVDECLVRGGSYMSNAGALKCNALDRRSPATRSDEIGFRCCE